ncbi:MAG: PEP-CTERM sorting domain-containing protein [Phycisphaeraceae bacterium]|nr:MAG: PEP-CTERM sorting domain-containing protein [Phycisphaeraceae bacterium]
MNSRIMFLGAVACTAMIANAGTTVVDFENGTEGWEGPQGFGGVSYVDPTGGVGGGAGYRTQFHDFGIAFTNSTNAAFVGDFSPYQGVTFSVDLKVDQIGTFFPVPRPFMLELRDFDTAQGGYPWSSVFYLFDWVSQDTYADFTTLSVTIDNTTSPVLPSGWGGYGSYDPNTFETMLPDGVTFADILSGVDEIAFSTLLPDYFFTDDDYDMTIDNVTVTTVVPAPAAPALLAFGGLLASRRRRTA